MWWILLAKLIGLIILALAIMSVYLYIDYKYVGWNDFSMKYGENFMLSTDNPDIGIPENIGNIRFKDTVVKITSTDKQTVQANITNVLNGMTKAFVGNKSPDVKFKLADPGLNPYSFSIEGVSDPVTTAGKTSLDEQWDLTKDITITGKMKIFI